MKKIITVLISIIILSMAVSVVAHGSEDDGGISLPNIPIPQHTESDDDTTDSTGTTSGDWEVTDVPFENKVSLDDCKFSAIKKKVYTGKGIKPSVTVKYNDTVLKKGKDYTVSYENNVNVGTASVIILGKGDYSGTVTKTFNIIPKSTVLSKVTSPKKGVMKAVWKKQAVQTTGYQLQYSIKKNFKNKKTVTVKKVKTVKKSVKNLKSSKTYYVRIRTFKKIGKKAFYSSWSETVSVKVK